MIVLLWCRDLLADVSRLIWPSQKDVLPDANRRAIGVVTFIGFFAVLLYVVDP